MLVVRKVLPFLKWIAHCALFGIAPADMVVHAQEIDDTKNQPVGLVVISASPAHNDNISVSNTLITREEIAKSGAQSVAELLQSLPAMQGFTNAAASVGGGGSGIETASLHGIGAEYTLVLVDDQRMASYGSGSGVNLASIPLSAIEKIEISTDGAATRYGTGAIGGVVNIILRKNSTEGDLQFTLNQPQHAGGGQSTNMSIAKGFGNLGSDGYNVFLAYSHDQSSSLDATQRNFSKTGYVPFSFGGSRYLFSNLTPYTSPASVTVLSQNHGDVSATQFSPNLLASGACSSNTFAVAGVCQYDYAATVQLLPQNRTNSAFASGSLSLGTHATLFTEMLWSDYSLTERANATIVSENLPQDSPLAQTYVAPYLSQLGINPANVTSLSVNMIFPDAGGQTQTFDTVARHFVVGIRGQISDWEYQTSLAHSVSNAKNFADSGMLSQNAVTSILTNGTYNPFEPPTNASAVLAPAQLHQLLDDAVSTLNSIQIQGTTDLFKTPGGFAHISIGAEFERQSYDDNPSSILQGPSPLQPGYTDSIAGANSTNYPYNTSRYSQAGFGELHLPLTSTLDLGTALRYNSYGQAYSSENVNSNGVEVGPAYEGNTFKKTTYQLALHFRPTKEIGLLASYGTGFRAPTLENITAPLTFAGTTIGQYACPVSSSDPRSVGCQGFARYDVLSGGNPNTGAEGLKPETSTETTLGLHFELSQHISLDFTVWEGHLSNSIAVLQEQWAFNNPAGYSDLFKLVNDPSRGQQTLAFEEVPINLATGSAAGIDWNHLVSFDSSIGKVRIQSGGSYILKFIQVFPDGQLESDLGRYGADQNVIFRLKSQLVATLQSSDHLSNSLVANYQSGYYDQNFSAADQTISNINPNGSIGPYVGFDGHRVASLTVFDWQTKIALGANSVLSLGIKNCFNRKPPFSLVTIGSGEQTGYDSRYASPLGRQFYLQALVHF